MQHKAWTFAGLGLVALAAVLFAVDVISAQVNANPRLAMAKALGLFSLTATGLALGSHPGTRAVFRRALIWSVTGLVAAILFAYRTAFASLLPDAAPPPVAASAPIPVAPGTVSVRAAANGHFIVDALVNGTHVTFLVDTGATDVALTRNDAKRIGIDVDALEYMVPVSTANGETMFAIVDLDEIEIGSIRVSGVRAAVFQGDFQISILGLSFLKRLSSFTVDSDRLVMRQ